MPIRLHPCDRKVLRRWIDRGYFDDDPEAFSMAYKHLRKRTKARVIRLLPRLSRANPAGYKKHRTIKHFGARSGFGRIYGLDPGDFKDHFMFTPDQFVIVFERLGFPPRLQYSRNHHTDSEDAFLLFLKRMRCNGGSTHADLKLMFGRCSGWISEVFRAVLLFLYDKFARFKVEQFDVRLFDETRLNLYAEGIASVCDLYYDMVKICGFIDGTTDEVARLSYGGYRGRAQQALFNGHKKDHVLLYEMVTFPDGMIARGFGPLAGANNDRVAVARGHIRDLVRQYFHGYALYGDSIYYSYTPEIWCPILDDDDEDACYANSAMSRVRVDVENSIGALYQRCGILDHEFHLGSELAYHIFVVAIFLQNVHTCVTRSNGVSSRFRVPPPLLDEYLDLS